MKSDNNTKANAIVKLAWRLDEAAAATGLSIQFLRKEVRANKLKTQRLGRCVVILDKELKRYLEGTTNEDE